MKTLLIVHHSTTGGTLQMARAAADAARAALADTGLADGFEVRLCRATDTAAADVLAAQGYLFATPEYLGSMAGLMKDFFDRSWYPVLEQLDQMAGRPYASLICAGSDGQGAARQLARFGTGWRLKAVAEPLIVCTQAQTPEQILRAKRIGPGDLARCAELGAALAAGLSLGVF